MSFINVDLNGDTFTSNTSSAPLLRAFLYINYIKDANIPNRFLYGIKASLDTSDLTPNISLKYFSDGHFSTYRNNSGYFYILVNESMLSLAAFQSMATGLFVLQPYSNETTHYQRAFLYINDNYNNFLLNSTGDVQRSAGVDSVYRIYKVVSIFIDSKLRYNFDIISILGFFDNGRVGQIALSSSQSSYGQLAPYDISNHINWKGDSDGIYNYDVYSSLSLDSADVYKFEISNYLEYIIPSSRPSSQPSSLPTGGPSSSPTRFCRAGKYIIAADCVDCGSGLFSASPMSKQCESCIPGSFSTPGSAQCQQCPVGFYSSDYGSPSCISCSAGMITPGLGSSFKNQCVSPVANFVFGFLALFCGIAVSYFYILNERFKMMALYRKSSIVDTTARRFREAYVVSKKIYKECNADTRLVAHESQPEIKSKVVKTWIFLLASLLITIIFGCVIFIGIASSIFFNSMILQRSFLFEIDKSFVAVIRRIVQNVSAILSLPEDIVSLFFWPLTYVIAAVADIKINLSSVNVTCSGASAPIELFINILILGFVIVVIESNYQLFQSISFNNLVNQLLLLITLPEFKDVVVGVKKWSSFRYIRYLAYTFVIYIVSCISIFKVILQYMMSFVVITPFFVDSYTFHESTEECNTISGLGSLDEILAKSSSVLLLLLIVPCLYELSRVLSPVLLYPLQFRYMRNGFVSDGHRQGSRLLLKYGMLTSPDVWLFHFLRRSVMSVCKIMNAYSDDSNRGSYVDICFQHLTDLISLRWLFSGESAEACEGDDFINVVVHEKDKEISLTDLPSYCDLLGEEIAALRNDLFKDKPDSNIRRYCVDTYLLPAILSALGIGHVMTSIGRTAFLNVFFKFISFLLVSVGIWTDRIYESYQIYDSVNNLSLYYSRDSEYDRTKYREDFSLAISSIICTRATLLQLFPSLSILSVFAIVMSPTPLFVFSSKLRENLPNLLVINPLLSLERGSLIR